MLKMATMCGLEPESLLNSPLLNSIQITIKMNLFLTLLNQATLDLMGILTMKMTQHKSSLIHFSTPEALIWICSRQKTKPHLEEIKL